MAGSCAKNPVNDMFEDAKKLDNTYALTVPGWLLRTSISKGIKDEDVKENITELESIKNGIKGARVLVSSKVDPTTLSKFNLANQDLANKGYDSYMFVKNKSANVNVWAKESKGKLKDIFFFVTANEDNNIVLFKLETDITTDQFNTIAKKVNTKIETK